MIGIKVFISHKFLKTILYFFSTYRKKLANANLKELMTGSSIFFLTKLLGVGLTYFFTWWVTSRMGAARWAYFAFCLTTLNVVAIFSLAGLDGLMIKYAAELRQKNMNAELKNFYLNSVFIIVVISSLFGYLLLSYAEFFAALFFGTGGLRPWLMAVGILIPIFTLTQINNAFLCGSKRMIHYGLYKNILPIGLTILVFLLCNEAIFKIHFPQYNDSGILLFGTFGLMTLLVMFGGFYSVFNIGKFSKSSKRNRFNFLNILRESFPLLLSSSMFLIIASTDIYMLSAMRPAEEVGVYDVAVKISLLAAIVLVAVNSISAPKFAELFGLGNLSGLKEVVSQSSKLIFWVTIPIIFLLIMLPEKFLGLFGSEFLAAAPALVILSIGQFISSISGSVGNLLKMTNNQIVFQYVMIAAAIINIGLNFILIPKYGITGAAIASATSMSFWNLISVIVAKKKLGITTLYFPLLRRYF